ncbi:MAG: RNA pseudouridine synthase [Holophagales bacterium]|nr:RNA pseudouridine synthase [Holophagales bacterium]
MESRPSRRGRSTSPSSSTARGGRGSSRARSARLTAPIAPPGSSGAKVSPSSRRCPPSRTAVHPAGRPALTRWRLLESRGEEALLELTPATGRMHQLRVHLAAIGHPLLGDPLYDAGTAPEAATGPAPFLRAIRIVWEEPPGAPSGTAWTFEAPASEMMPA